MLSALSNDTHTHACWGVPGSQPLAMTWIHVHADEGLCSGWCSKQRPGRSELLACPYPQGKMLSWLLSPMPSAMATCPGSFRSVAPLFPKHPPPFSFCCHARFPCCHARFTCVFRDRRHAHMPCSDTCGLLTVMCAQHPFTSQNYTSDVSKRRPWTSSGRPWCHQDWPEAMWAALVATGWFQWCAMPCYGQALPEWTDESSPRAWNHG